MRSSVERVRGPEGRLLHALHLCFSKEAQAQPILAMMPSGEQPFEWEKKEAHPFVFHLN